MVISFAALAILVAATPQDLPGREQAAVDKAIEKGIAFLKKAGSPSKVDAPNDPNFNSDELILWTFLHAGVSQDDPVFRKLFASMMKKPLERTYPVSLRALVLEEIDPGGYQGQIAQCAQFLVDNQCPNGQWHYGTPTPALKGTPTFSNSRPATSSQGGVRNFGVPQVRKKTKVTRKIRVRQTRFAKSKEGDNSNSQYAILALRACADAGITLPRGVLLRAKKWWTDSQHEKDKGDRPAIASGRSGGTPRGWCYSKKGVHKPAYGSMTAGAVGSLAILDHLLRTSPKRDMALRDGLAWLEKNYSVTANVGPCQHSPKDPKAFYCYTMYAIERAGILCVTETFGSHKWYPEGAKALVAAQKSNGSWKSSRYMHNLAAWDTCFAILFLRRATRPMVASVDR